MEYPIFLLHCPGHSNYRDGAAARITEYFGRDIHVVTGTEPGMPLFEEKRKEFTRICPNLTSGQVGCAIGSRVMLERFLETGAPYALLFEDDVLLTSEYSAKDFDAVLDEMHAMDRLWDWMILFAPYTADWNTVVPEPDQFDKRIRKCLRLSLATHAYAVSRKGAMILLEMSRELDRAWDLFTFNGGFGRAYHGPPLCYIKDDEDSVIAAVSKPV